VGQSDRLPGVVLFIRRLPLVVKSGVLRCVWFSLVSSVLWKIPLLLCPFPFPLFYLPTGSG